MSTDYKALCEELFGTSDEDKLREIAEKVEKVNRPNSRGAGRKPKFSKSEVLLMRELQAQGVSMTGIAEKFGTSRQTISKYLCETLEGSYTLKIDFMYKTSVCTTILVDFVNEKIQIFNKTDDIMHRAFGVLEEPTWEDFEYFLEDRCFSRYRGDVKEVLALLELDSYDPLQICERNKGRTFEDAQWMKFTYKEPA